MVPRSLFGTALLLLASLGFGQGKGEFKKLKEEYDKAAYEYMRPYREARTAEELAKIKTDVTKSPFRIYPPRFKALAERAGKTEEGFLAWMEFRSIRDSSLTGLADVEIADAALMKTFIDTPWMGKFAEAMPYASGALLPAEREKKVVGMLQRVEKENPYPAVKAKALYAQGQFYAPNSRGDTKTAASIYRRVVAKYPTSEAASLARRDLFEFEHLIPGAPALDFRAIDENGKPFKLSDYRGKVVLLEFWGIWCGPCRTLMPGNVQMVEKYKDKPFAIVGVNVGDNRATVKKFVDEQKLNYRSAIDGGWPGKIVKEWNVSQWPTLYLIGPDGMIRQKLLDPTPEAVEKAVEDILNKAGNRSDC